MRWRTNFRAISPQAPVCPECGKRAIATRTQYGVRYDCCGLHSWDGAPLVDEETHKARQTAHEVFDRLWKDGLMSRSRAYARLSHMLGITPEQCHMKVMTKRVALQVPDAVEKIRQSVIYARARQSARDKEAARRSRQC